MAESFEQTEYSDPKDPRDDLSLIYQIVHDFVSKDPAIGIQPSLTGKYLRLTYTCYEMHLPTRLKVVEDQAHQRLKDMVSYLKKEFKKATKRTLSLKEKKDMEDYNTQKVSLNERYHYSRWRFFEIS
jgi:hypothetical protein